MGKLAWTVGCAALLCACGNGNSATDAGADATNGTDSAPPDASTSCDGPCNVVPTGLLNPDYTTTWNPGILADTPTGNPLGPDGLPVRTTTCATVPAQGGNATQAIQSALDGCKGKNQVVALAAGTYTISATLTVPSGVVLRGAGSDAATGTVIVSTNGGPVDRDRHDAGHGLLRQRIRRECEAAPRTRRDEGDDHDHGRDRERFCRGRSRARRSARRSRGQRGRLHDHLQARRQLWRERARRDRFGRGERPHVDDAAPLDVQESAERAHLTNRNGADEMGRHRERARARRSTRRVSRSERGRHRRLERRVQLGEGRAGRRHDLGHAHPARGDVSLRGSRQPLSQLVQLRLRRRTTTASSSRAAPPTTSSRTTSRAS